MHFIHSAFAGNDLYMQLIDQLNHSEKQNISTDHKFIMEKKFPYSVFLALFYSKGFHAMGPQALMLKDSGQITKHTCKQDERGKCNGKAELDKDR